jgi:hypothetical protein
MKITGKYTFIILIIVSILLFCFIPLGYDHNYKTNPIQVSKNETEVSLNFGIRPALNISFYINTDKPIEIFVLKKGFIRIGNNDIIFDPEIISIYGEEIDSRYILIWDELGKENGYKHTANQEQNIQYMNKNDNFRYAFSLHRYINENTPDIIRKENITELKVFLEYSITLDNNINDEIICEYFNLNIKTRRLMGFHLIAFIILGRLGILKL